MLGRLDAMRGAAGRGGAAASVSRTTRLEHASRGRGGFDLEEDVREDHRKKRHTEGESSASEARSAEESDGSDRGEVRGVRQQTAQRSRRDQRNKDCTTEASMSVGLSGNDGPVVREGLLLAASMLSHPF